MRLCFIRTLNSVLC
uniref:Uncharacterized protein n=1 Tax=Arundo donax TaxID=35708 RepID=A0A0A8Z758_ARUDO